MFIIKKLLNKINNNDATNGTTNGATNDDTTDDDNSIDLLKTFSSDSIDVSDIIKEILKLDKEFPNTILYSKDGHKYNELEFFQANLDSNVNSKNASLFDKFNRTHTQLGKTLLQSIILQPITTISILKHRQNQASLFLNHSQKDKIKTLLLECSKLEKDILAMQMKDTPEMEEVYKVIFFEFMLLKQFNYNELFLKYFYYFIIIFSPAYGAIAPFIFMFAPYIFMRYVLKVPVPFETFWMVLKKLVMGGTGFFTNLNKIINSDIGKVAETIVNNGMRGFNGGGGGNGGGNDGGNGGGFFNSFSIKNIIISIVKWIVAFMNTSAGTYFYLGFIIISYLYGIYNSIQSSITYNKIINMFHSRINIISKWVKNAVKCFKMKLGFESPEIIPIVNEIYELLQHPTLINLLNHDCFNCEPSLFSNKGIIIKTFKEFLDAKKIIQPFCKYLAHIDVWYGVSTWLNEDGTITKRSLCSFITESDTPIVKGTSIWNICCEKPIYNDIKLGYENKDETKDETKDENNDETKDETKDEDKDEDKEVEAKRETKETFNNLLITGPNGSGKSTYIKSVIECILLGQTIGVVPAETFMFTPFVNISTYLNIPDCQGKESLFQAEMSRCYQQLQMLTNAETKGDFSFNIMDEIFVSTNYQEGMSGAYAIIKKMCHLNKSLNIITTHFDVLAGMDEVKVDKHYFDIEIDENDIIISDYKIKPGVSKKHFALKLLKQKGFDASIIADAEFLYDKLQGFDTKKTEVKTEVETDIVVEDVVEDVVKETKLTLEVNDLELDDLELDADKT